MVEGLPPFESVVSRLERDNLAAIKWTIQDEAVVYAYDREIDWALEFRPFLQNNINKLRFKDAYDIEDRPENDTRQINITATQANVEVRALSLTLSSDSITGFRLHKARSNVFSSSDQMFVFDGNRYALSVNQRIPFLFDNAQYMCADLVPSGKLWRIVFNLNGTHMPLIGIEKENGLYLKNGAELLFLPKTAEDQDSATFSSPYFNTHFTISTIDATKRSGRWVNAKGEKVYSIPVSFQADVPYRFKPAGANVPSFAGTHAIVFEEDGVFSDSAVLVIEQDHHMITGSVLTETGDYRWLEGVVRNDSLLMSTMDGSHVFHFAAGGEKPVLQGVFLSSTTWQQAFQIILHEPPVLRKPEAITRLRSGEVFGFAFPDSSGKMIDLRDPAFEHKVVLVSLMGSWCPNCMDEAAFLQDVLAQFGDEKLAVVGLSFEAVRDSNRAWKNIKRFQDGLGVRYPVLLASLSTNKTLAGEVVNTLNEVRSYPTLIVMDRSHRVVQIHTGFNGPATGEVYATFKRSYINLIDSLIQSP
jgi:peroxiredoxin